MSERERGQTCDAGVWRYADEDTGTPVTCPAISPTQAVRRVPGVAGGIGGTRQMEGEVWQVVGSLVCSCIY